MSAYPHLLSPITLGGVTLRNRAVMGSMHVGLEDRAKHLPELAAFFAARARGGVGLIVTGGYAVNWHGWLSPLGSQMTSTRMADKHRVVTDAVHAEDGRILLQLIHAGRYGYHPFSHGASGKKSPITPFRPRAMSTRQVAGTVRDFARAAALAKRAGYDGVEIMGSEGYLINQMLAARTNDRTDRYGGSASNRMNFPTEIVTAVRESVGDTFVVQYRMSLLDLVDDSQNWAETVELAQRLEAAGVTNFNTGIGWHEARIPTIITSVPRAAFAWTTGKLREHVSVPVIASNRINTPEVAEQVLASGQADLVSMARPLLADPDFMLKAMQDRADEINTCIGCNQACIDHSFEGKRSSCLVNPRAGHETTLVLGPTRAVKTIGVVGAGPAGLAAATELAGRGHRVELFEARGHIGGQFRLAMTIPGKEEFRETIRYFDRRIDLTDVKLHLGRRAEVEDLTGMDEVVLATGVTPRIPDIPGVDLPHVITYEQLLTGERTAGNRVAVLGAGGIGFDVCEYLLHDQDESLEDWNARWGVVDPEIARGGLGPQHTEPARREVVLMQRKSSSLGKGLGKTTGWVHRATLRRDGVEMLAGVTYERITPTGIDITVTAPADARGGRGKQETRTVARSIECDTVVLCTGQESVTSLAAPLLAAGVTVHVIGGADLAAELDAKRAIRQATEVAAAI